MLFGAKIKISGVNISRLYKLLKNKGINMVDICRQDYKTLLFSVKSSDVKKVFELTKNSSYKTEIVSYLGLKKFTEYLKKRFGYLIGVGIFLIVLVVSNLFVSDIKVYGLETINQTDIMLLLNQNGLYIGAKIYNQNTDEIGEILSSNFKQISLISVIKKGTCIIINIKEKQSLSFEEVEPKI